MHKNSTITYVADFVNDRSIKINGEAVFNVATVQDKTGIRQPFTVSIDDLAVNVTGTTFLVSKLDSTNTSQVALYEAGGDTGVFTYMGYRSYYLTNSRPNATGGVWYMRIRSTKNPVNTIDNEADMNGAVGGCGANIRYVRDN